MENYVSASTGGELRIAAQYFAFFLSMKHVHVQTLVCDYFKTSGRVIQVKRNPISFLSSFLSYSLISCLVLCSFLPFSLRFLASRLPHNRLAINKPRCCWAVQHQPIKPITKQISSLYLQYFCLLRVSQCCPQEKTFIKA